MKKLLLVPAVAVFILSSCVNNPKGEKAEATDSVSVENSISGDVYTVDATQSQVIWTGAKVSGEHTGTVDVKEGSLIVQEGKIVSGNFVLDLNTINTTDLEGEYKDKLDEHLKNEDFFNVAQFPTASFQITNVEDAAEAGKVKVSGNLTIKDITKNISFDATVVEITESSAKVEADFNIAREDWGVTYEGKKDDLISKEINFKVSLVANK